MKREGFDGNFVPWCVLDFKKASLLVLCLFIETQKRQSVQSDQIKADRFKG